MWSMWNVPSDRDYYDPLGVDCDQDEPEICEGCGRPMGLGRGLRAMVRNESGRVETVFKNLATGGYLR